MDETQGPRTRILEVQDLSVDRQGREVLKGLNLSFDGGVLAILGPNGAGKTTLLSAIVTLVDPSSGRVLVSGQDPRGFHGRKFVRGAVGFQPQTPVHAARFTLLESVRYAGWLKGMKSSQSRTAALSALRSVNLDDLRDDRADRLSGGQSKRLAIAQAIVHGPSLLVLDEPTASLDPSERAELIALLRRLSEATSIVYSTHIATDVQRLADEVVVVVGGKVRFHDSTAEFLGQRTGDPEDQVERSYSHILDQI